MSTTHRDAHYGNPRIEAKMEGNMQRSFCIALLTIVMLAIAIAANAQAGKVTCTYTSFKVLQGSQPGVGGINDSDWVSGSAQTGQPMMVGFVRKPSGTISTFLINS